MNDDGYDDGYDDFDDEGVDAVQGRSERAGRDVRCRKWFRGDPMSRTREDFALHELAAGRPGAKELYDQVYADAENSGTTT